jgi:hypothetical protein
VIGRGADAIGCAHCEATVGANECRICGRIVCDACAADWTTCSEPSGRVVRLGMTARLRAVDPDGRFGLVTAFRHPWRALDLRQLRWVDCEIELASIADHTAAPMLTADGRLLETDGHVLYVGSLGTPRWNAYRAERSIQTLRVMASGWVSFVSSADTVELVDLNALEPAPYMRHILLADRLGDAPAISLTPFPGRVVQSAAAVREGDALIVASGTWQEIAIHRIRGELRERTAHVKTDGDVRWIAIAGSTVAAIVVGARSGTLTTWRIDDRGELAHRVDRDDHGEPVIAASLSRDGRYLAAALADRSVAVHAVVEPATQVFTEHTDAISLIRFAGDDHLLITADDDNRVVLRPRTEHGYAEVVMPVELPDEAIAFKPPPPRR